jgi:hypothetical protein
MKHLIFADLHNAAISYSVHGITSRRMRRSLRLKTIRNSLIPVAYSVSRKLAGQFQSDSVDRHVKLLACNCTRPATQDGIVADIKAAN